MADWRRLSWSDRAAWVIGSGFGCGLSPIAPGTVGSAAAGAVFYVITLLLPADWFYFRPLYVVALLSAIGLAVGVWATGRMSTEANPDPGAAVWDEFVGMWISCLPIAFFWDVLSPYWILPPFFLFRLLDILKPWPCRRLERLHGGWGIMLDDVAAGLWGGVAIFVALAGLTVIRPLD